MGTPVWLVASTFEPRGSSVYTLRLAENLPEHGFDPVVLCTSAQRVPERLRRKLRIVETPFLDRPMLRWLGIRRALAQLAGETPALLHAQRTGLDRVTAELADRLSCPYAITVHEILPPESTIAVLPERLGAVIAVSPSVERDLAVEANVPIDLIRMVPTGVETPPDPRLPPPRAIEEVPVIGCASAMEPSKGLSYFLMAAELILSSGQDAEFLIAGSGPDEQALRRIAQHLDIANRVTFASHVQEYGRILETLDVFVLPSLTQGAGTIMFEAMALGKPVVATRVGGVADFLVDGEHALLVPPANHVLLAEKVQLLLDNPERARKLASAGQRLVRERFSVERMTEATAEVYRRILAGRLAPALT